MLGEPWKTDKQPGYTICTWQQEECEDDYYLTIFFDINNIYFEIFDWLEVPRRA